MSPSPFDFEPDGPAVCNPELRALVQSVRQRPAVGTNVELASIRRQILAKGRGFRTGVASGVLLAAAAAAAFWIMGPASNPPSAHAVDAGQEPEAVAGPVAYVPYAEAVHLSDAVKVTWRGGVPPRALGAWELELGRGSYEVALAEPRPEKLSIHVGTRVLELSHGEVSLATHDSTPVVTLRSGVAAWVGADGSRTPLVIETMTASRGEADGEANRRTASELAREAERLLAGGDRDAAIVVLRKLVLRHPKSLAAQSALLDLGRELSKEGMRDHARCAYEMYLERWPQGQMRAEVRRSLERLGDGASCIGLRPG